MAGQSVFEVIEGYYLALILDAFLRTGILDRLRDEITTGEAAVLLDEDEAVARALLEFAAESSDIVERAPAGTYRLRARYRSWSSLPFHLHKLVGAYGRLLAQLGATASAPQVPATTSRLAQAYAGLHQEGATLVGVLLRGSDVRSLLDIGCGPGRLLVELAGRDEAFRGWGIDTDPSMCSFATERIRSAGLDGRVSICQHPFEDVESLQMSGLDDVAAIHAGNVLNAFFWPSSARAVDVVSGLTRRFPGRRLFVSDYYGQLTHRRRIGVEYRQTLLQDVAQAVSHQGIPPRDRDAWLSIYQDAGAVLQDVVEGSEAGIRWFLHTVRLGFPAAGV
ncbi:cyclopropane-fatty-acyl-phospholipid synthase family protein [Kribbella sp. VKM Ac-2566]|uniref:SAM-dependent methyltransferase n=1 Tax=Kribbella sp. VKM Ac-2566 TaxID=2512218 RepID=UPI00106378FE|nr:class I SAM-dependent methyltransferase [Kribbella sp. VKM Ac-2566]TDW91135.1 methyltransferase family protein [Kribbella sp. VKM Ac-2566]